MLNKDNIHTYIENHQKDIDEPKEAKETITSESAKMRDAQELFNQSIELARLVGVPEDSILKNKEDIDNFFN